MNELCADIVTGHHLLNEYVDVKIIFGKRSLKGLSLTLTNLESVSQFLNLSPDCKPIAVISCRYNRKELKFSEEEEENRLLTENGIEPSDLPWRAQVLVTNSILIRRDKFT